MFVYICTYSHLPCAQLRCAVSHTHANMEQACFSRHSSLGRDGAFTPAERVTEAKTRPDSGRAIRSLFGSKPRTLREDSDSPAEKLRLGRLASVGGGGGGQPVERIIRFGHGAPDRAPLASNGSSPDYSAATYLYRRGGADVLKHVRPSSSGESERERDRERVQVRGAWKEVSGRETEREQRLSNLMQVS